VKVVSTFLRVASSRSQPTTIRFSGHANAHKLQPIHSVSPRFRVIVEPRRAAIPLRHHRSFQRILLRNNVLGMLRSKRDREALQKIDLKQSFQESLMGLVCFSPPQLSSKGFLLSALCPLCSPRPLC